MPRTRFQGDHHGSLFRRGGGALAEAPGGLPGLSLHAAPCFNLRSGGNEIKPQIYMSYAMPFMAVSTALRKMCKIPSVSVHFAVAQCGNLREAHNLGRSRVGGGRGRPPELLATGRVARGCETGRRPRGSALCHAGWLPSSEGASPRRPREEPAVGSRLDGAILWIFWSRRETFVRSIQRKPLKNP